MARCWPSSSTRSLLVRRQRDCVSRHARSSSYILTKGFGFPRGGTTLSSSCSSVIFGGGTLRCRKNSCWTRGASHSQGTSTPIPLLRPPICPSPLLRPFWSKRENMVSMYPLRRRRGLVRAAVGDTTTPKFESPVVPHLTQSRASKPSRCFLVGPSWACGKLPCRSRWVTGRPTERAAQPDRPPTPGAPRSVRPTPGAPARALSASPRPSPRSDRLRTRRGRVRARRRTSGWMAPAPRRSTLGQMWSRLPGRFLREIIVSGSDRRSTHEVNPRVSSAQLRGFDRWPRAR